MRFIKLLLIFLIVSVVEAQVQHFPFIENFDSVVAPALPPGWTTTTNYNPSGDFTVKNTSAYSDTNAILSTNATISQSLTSPLLNFSELEVDTLKFYERRSSTHKSGLLIEASTNGGSTFSVFLSDTLNQLVENKYVLRKLKLSPILSGLPSVKIRWHIIGDGPSNSKSGTIRFDDITITALYHTDAAVTSIIFQPFYPIIGDSVNVFTTIKNVGLQPVQNISVEFYEDSNNNALPESGELFSTFVINQTLQPADTIIAQAWLHNVALGEHNIIIRTLLTGDQNNSNDIRQAKLLVGLPPSTVVVNEIMYAPNNPEPEWIELFNTSSDSIELQDWKISNRNTTARYTIASTSTIIKPKEYCILTKDIGTFTAVHPDIASPIVQISTLPSYLFNNTGDAVVLFDYRGAIMDSVQYNPAWGGSEGKSLERIEYRGNSNDPTNWGTSGDSLGSTPGKQNFLTPLEYNLSVLRLSSMGSSLQSALISVVIRNTGHQPANIFSVSLFNDADGDSIPQTSELIETKNVSTPLAFKDSLAVNFSWSNPPSGRKLLIAVVDYPQDMRTKDNMILCAIEISFPSSALIINEIMYEPRTGEAEYVELFNPSNEAVDIFGWKLSDVRDTSTTSKKYVISQSAFVVGSREFAVIAFDSSVFNRFSYLRDSTYKVIIKEGSVSLNNEGDNIILTDLTGTTIDSVHYFPTWHNPDVEDISGRSLERINPNLPSNDRRNWSTSANPLGGTPGKQNSIYTTSVPSIAAISFSPNPFSPDGDGHEDVTIISYQLPATTAVIRARIYDAKGRLIRTLADGEPSGAQGEIIWDGFNDRRERVRMGIYIVLLESLDGLGGNVQTAKGTVVVAVKL